MTPLNCDRVRALLHAKFGQEPYVSDQAIRRAAKAWRVWDEKDADGMSYLLADLFEQHEANRRKLRSGRIA
jgi:hypothetical protein